MKGRGRENSDPQVEVLAQTLLDITPSLFTYLEDLFTILHNTKWVRNGD